ncbi:hypothetical protein TWF730_008939 [Orbilia blumenaviensis]|uniref:Uncharacterized protein n=1 Tax=Orbilia blumenaviensis TaxID=1796055 RepID=A0AAV9V0X0_9PEZI
MPLQPGETPLSLLLSLPPQTSLKSLLESDLTTIRKRIRRSKHHLKNHPTGTSTAATLLLSTIDKLKQIADIYASAAMAFVTAKDNAEMYAISAGALEKLMRVAEGLEGVGCFNGEDYGDEKDREREREKQRGEYGNRDHERRRMREEYVKDVEREREKIRNRRDSLNPFVSHPPPPHLPLPTAAANNTKNNGGDEDENGRVGPTREQKGKAVIRPSENILPTRLQPREEFVEAVKVTGAIERARREPAHHGSPRKDTRQRESPRKATAAAPERIGKHHEARERRRQAALAAEAAAAETAPPPPPKESTHPLRHRHHTNTSPSKPSPRRHRLPEPPGAPTKLGPNNDFELMGIPDLGRRKRDRYTESNLERMEQKGRIYRNDANPDHAKKPAEKPAVPITDRRNIVDRRGEKAEASPSSSKNTDPKLANAGGGGRTFNLLKKIQEWQKE